MDKDIDRALARGRRQSVTEPRASKARYDRRTGRIVVDLTNGCSFVFPARSLQGLERASDAELAGRHRDARPPRRAPMAARVAVLVAPPSEPHRRNRNNTLRFIAIIAILNPTSTTGVPSWRVPARSRCLPCDPAPAGRDLFRGFPERVARGSGAKATNPTASTLQGWLPNFPSPSRASRKAREYARKPLRRRAFRPLSGAIHEARNFFDESPGRKVATASSSRGPGAPRRRRCPCRSPGSG